MSQKTRSVILWRVASLGAAVMLMLILSHCTTSVSPAPPPMSDQGYVPRASGVTADKAKVTERPGLGTQLGGDLYDGDRSSPAFFHRKPTGSPDAVATFHYNDAEGARLMAALSGRVAKHRGAFELVPGKLRVALVALYGGDTYDHYVAGGKAFVIGVPGESYELRLENLTKARMEVVISIDGLDVLDAQTASVRKHGYVIAAQSAATIRGMRVGGKLKSLIFSSVATSRASTAFGEKGARNVGVIGMACYEEDEAARRLARVKETYLRDGARAFGN